MKIVLVRCPAITVSFHPPDIGLVYLASVLKEEKHQVFIFDLNIELYHKSDETDKKKMKYSNIESFVGFEEEILQKYASFFEKAIGRILNLQPEIIGFCVWHSNSKVSLELAKRLKENNPSAFIVFGGPECYPLSSGEKFAQEEFIDSVVYGESENTIKILCDSLSKNKKAFPIPGMIVNLDGKIIDCGWGEVIKDLDQLPPVALNLFPLELYVTEGVLPISFNRGCIYRCEYCPTELYPGFRSRSAENIIQEIEYCIQKYPDKNSFLVCDSSITSNLQQIEQLCDLILSKGVKVGFGGFAATHPGLNHRILSTMKRAGFNAFVYGVESGSERLLSKIGKKIKLETIERIIKESFQAGIEVGVDMMVGIPGESEDDFNQSLDFLARNKQFIKDVGINECAEMPYSYVFSHRDEFEIIPQETKMRRRRKLKETVGSLNFLEAGKIYIE